LLIETVGAIRSWGRVAMKKKTGKTRGSRQRKAVRDLPADKAKGVKGGKASFTDFQFVHKVDKASPVLLQS
jgi:type VI protein secretion system component Hcp